MRGLWFEGFGREGKEFFKHPRPQILILSATLSLNH